MGTKVETEAIAQRCFVKKVLPKTPHTHWKITRVGVFFKISSYYKLRILQFVIISDYLKGVSIILKRCSFTLLNKNSSVGCPMGGF